MSIEISGAEKAYKTAQERIAEAAAQNSTELDLEIYGLTTLPPEIASLTTLEILDLSDTQVDDIAPIANLTALKSLNLIDTQVADITPIASLTTLDILGLNDTEIHDLRPILNVPSLINNGPLNGIYFLGSKACERDPNLARLGEIFDNQERTQKTFDYLRTLPKWPAPLPWENEFDPVAVPKLILTEDHRIDLVDETIDENDIHDDVSRDAYGALQDEIHSLNRFTNQYFELDGVYKKLVQLTDGDFNTLNIFRLHLTITKIGALRNDNDKRDNSERYSSDCLHVLDTILSLGPQITMGNAQVKEGEKRIREFHNQDLDKTKIDTERKVIIALGTKAELITAKTRDEITDITSEPTSPQIETYRSDLLRNSFLLLARMAGAGVDAVSGLIATEAAKFIFSHAPEFIAIAGSWGNMGSVWVEAVVRQVRCKLGI